MGRDTSEEGSETLPAKVTLADKIVQISAGDSHTAALTDDGRVIAWGNFRVSGNYNSSKITLSGNGCENIKVIFLGIYV